MCVCVQLVLRRAAVGDIHARWLSLPRHPSGGTLQAAKGGTPHGQASQLHPRAVGASVDKYADWLSGLWSHDPSTARQVHDHAGVLARSAVPEANLQAAGGGPRPCPVHDLY